jgi:hypothetical protein
MKKNTSKEAFYNRLQQLAEVNEFKKANSGLRNIGTLIDYKRSDDGVAFGIVKENHHYYIKKGGLKKDLDASDFTYLDGLENITSYQYKTISEADKQRNALLTVINNSSKVKISNNGSKIVLNENNFYEDAATDELNKSEDKFEDLSVATAAKKNFPTDLGNTNDPNSGVESSPQGELPAVDTATPPGVGDQASPENFDSGEGLGTDDSLDSTSAESTPEDNADNGEGGEPSANLDSDPTKAIEKAIGKLGNVIRKTKLTPEESESYLKSLIASFSEKLKEVDVTNRKEIANKILKVDNNDAEQDLESSLTDDLQEVLDNNGSTCNECGSFVKYAESRGYNKKIIKESGNEEKANLISGYVNAFNEGKNDGDFKTVRLFTNMKINELLKEDYGHVKYVGELARLNESFEANPDDEDAETQMNNLPWTKNKDKNNKQDKKKKSDKKMLKEEVKRKIKKLMKNFGQGVAQKIAKKFGNKILEEGAELNEVQAIAQKLAKKAVKRCMKDYGKGTAKKIAGELGNTILEEGNEDLSTKKIAVKAIAQRIAGKKVKKFMKNYGKGTTKKIAGELGNKIIKEGIEDVDDIDVDVDTDTPDTEKSPFANDTQSLGIVTPSHGGTSTGDINVDVDSQSKKINIAITEAKRQIDHLTKKITQLTEAAKANDEKKKPSAGLSKEKKSEVIKAAKKGEDIGKKGKGFEKVEKAAEKNGAKDPKAVAAAAMWKNIPRKGKALKENMSESEVKLRKYIKNRLMEISGLKKAPLNESAKSEKIKQLDNLIGKQYTEFKNIAKK